MLDSNTTLKHPLEDVFRRTATRLFTFVLSMAAALAPMMSAVYESFNWARLGVVMAGLIGVHVILHPRLVFTRELGLYTGYFLFMCISLLWAPSVKDGLNSIIPAADFVIIMLLLGSLVALHHLRSVLAGLMFGFVIGAVWYTRAFGFPFSYPVDFSYNAIAGMYLFGLFATLLYAWQTNTRYIPLVISLIVLALIAATTSIKTNLGILLGAASGSFFYLGSFLRIMRRNAILLIVFLALLVYAIFSNNDLLERVQRGVDRVSHGVEILQQREDVAGNTSFSERTAWEQQGIKGWLRSPMFGNGVEAFRTDNGITSHSTPIDLLYNFGVVGFSLFYAVFGSLVLRLWAVRGVKLGSLPALIFAGIVCYTFMTLSGTLHYNMFVAIFAGVSSGLMVRLTPRDAA